MAIQKTKKKTDKKTSVKKKTEKKSVEKTAVKKAPKKSSSQKKAPAKKVRKTAAKKTAKPKVQSKKSVNPKVVLPNSPTEAMVSKVSLLEALFSERVTRSFYIVAYVSALCFMVVGSTFALSAFFAPDTNLASVASSTEYQSETEQPELSAIQHPEPNLEFLTEVPYRVQNETWVVFSVVGLNNFWVGLREVGTGKYFQLSDQEMSVRKRKVLIDPSIHDEGYYVLSIKAQALNGTGEKIYESGVFFIGSQEDEDALSGIIPDEDSQPAFITNQNEAEERGLEDFESEIPIATSTIESESEAKVQETENSEEESQKEKKVQEDDESSSEDEIKEEEPAEEKDESLETAPEPKFGFADLSDQKAVGTVVLPFIADRDPKFIELYARPDNSLDKIFLGLGIESEVGWRFIVDTTMLVNGVYELTAIGQVDGAKIKSKSKTLTVANVPEVIKRENLPPEDTATATTSPVEIKREFLAVNPEPRTSTTSNLVISERAKELVDENNEDLTDLAKRYSVAVQSGDDILIDTADRELEKAKKAIVLKTLSVESEKMTSDDLEEELTAHFEEVKNRIKAFEEIRTRRSEGETAVDTDEDGVSDFDEINIYRTDPNSRDSDNDGVTDGIEIVRGYNPNDSGDEVSLTYESPKNFKTLEREDVLVVESVIAIKTTDDTRATPAVRAEIKGRGLPNSFVTIYIFSEPTIVTVKTDADGSFVYTFDKELADGEHEVYVAINDNSGSIIAQSKPFAFVKEAQAFSPVDAAEDVVIVPATTEQSSAASMQAVLGLGILALGLILLMLGIGLRSQEEENNLLTSTDETGGDGSESKVSLA